MSAANVTDTDFVYVFPSGIATDASGSVALNWSDAGGAFGQKRPLALSPGAATVQGIPAALSAEECAQVVAMGEALPRNSGRVELGPDAYRVSHIAWIEPQPANHWLFHKLGVLFDEAGKRYGMELAGFIDALQYTVCGPGAPPLITPSQKFSPR